MRGTITELYIVPFSIIDGGAMQGLDFRKKRRRSSNRPRVQKGRAARKGLRFEDKGEKLRSAMTRLGSPAGIKSTVLWGVEILIICMTAVFLVAAFGQRVSVAGDSMSPALKNGDVALVNRLVYRFIKPARGDVIVFSQSGDTHYSVKRVVGLPGETVQIKDGVILINGEELTKNINVSDIEYAGLAEEPVEVSVGEYFVIGDNHTASDDSRVPGVGNVNIDDIYGKAWFIAGPWEDMGFI